MEITKFPNIQYLNTVLRKCKITVLIKSLVPEVVRCQFDSGAV